MAMNPSRSLRILLLCVRQTAATRARTALVAVFAASLLTGAVAPLVAAQSVISLSPDVTIPIGAGNLVTADHAVAVDNQLGIVALQNLGAIPDAADVIGYAEGASGSKLLTFDTTVSLAGGVVARPGDVVALNGSTYSIVFSAAQAGLAPGVQTDALASASTGGLLLSFDTDVSLPGALHVADEDLVRWSGTTFSLALDGSSAGMSRALDVDAADDLGTSTFLVSFDSGGSIGSVSFADEDVLRYSNGTWTLERDGSAADADWVAANLDAMQMVPEIDRGAMLIVGIVFLGLMGGRLRRRRAAGSGLVQATALGIGAIALLAALPARASEGVLEIHQTCALNGGCFPGDTAGFPVTITASGSYRLSSNLTMTDVFSNGIAVNTSNVSIDLNGFAVIGQIVCSGTPTTCAPTLAGGTGILGSDPRKFIRVRNGTVRGMGNGGVDLGSGSEVTDLRVTSNGGSGIVVRNDAVVSGNLVYQNGLVGVVARGGSVVTNNAVSRNGTDGIGDGANLLNHVGVLASGNSVYQNGVDGLVLVDEGSSITGNTVYDNGQHGILAGDGAMVNGNTMVSNANFGLSNFGSGAVTFTDNVMSGNSANVESGSGMFDRGGNSCGGTATCP